MKFDINIEGDQYEIRKALFEANLQLINEHNSNPDNTFRLGITPFSFYTEEEKLAVLGVTSDPSDADV